jgi:hypothetical protein
MSFEPPNQPVEPMAAGDWQFRESLVAAIAHFLR